MDLRELYQEVIIDHNRNPRHHYAIPQASCSAEGYNSLCGDRVFLYLKVKGDKIIDASFTGGGCAISTASASMMTEALMGLSLDEASQLFETFHEAIIESDQNAWKRLGKLAVLEGVKSFPVRIKCATLAWHTLRSALNKQNEIATSE